MLFLGYFSFKLCVLRWTAKRQTVGILCHPCTSHELAQTVGQLMRLYDSSHDDFTKAWAHFVNHMPYFQVRLSEMTDLRELSDSKCGVGQFHLMTSSLFMS